VEVRDGAIDPERLERAGRRLVWLLKAPQDDVRCADLVGALREAADRKRLNGPEWNQTFSFIAKISFALLHPEMPLPSWISRDDLYLPALAEIGLLCMKRTLGGADDWNDLRETFRAAEPQLRARLDAMRPDLVLVAGGAASICRPWLGNWRPVIPFGGRPYQSTRIGDAVWVHVNYPTVRNDPKRYLERLVAGITSASTSGGGRAR